MRQKSDIVFQQKEDKNQQSQIYESNYKPNKQVKSSCMDIFCSCFGNSKKVAKKQKINYFKEIGQQNIEDKGKKTLILDLDETLVHASFEYIPNPDYTLVVVVEGFPYRFHIKVRPYVDQFLQQLSNFYEIMIFTASLKEYADEVLKQLFYNDKISYCLYRQHCKFNGKNYVKDISRVPRELKDMIIVDNQLNCFSMHPQNGFLIKNFYDDQDDRELLKLIPFLKFMSDVNDVRDIRKWHYQFRLQVPVSYISMQKKESVWNPPVKIKKEILLSGNITSDDDEDEQNNILKQKQIQENTPFHNQNIEEKNEKTDQNFGLLGQNIVKPSSFRLLKDNVKANNIEIQSHNLQKNQKLGEQGNYISSKQEMDNSLESDLEEYGNKNKKIALDNKTGQFQTIQDLNQKQDNVQLNLMHDLKEEYPQINIINQQYQNLKQKVDKKGQFTAIQEVTEYEDQESRSRGFTEQALAFAKTPKNGDTQNTNFIKNSKKSNENLKKESKNQDICDVKNQISSQDNQGKNQIQSLEQQNGNGVKSDILELQKSPRIIDPEMIMIQIKEQKSEFLNKNSSTNTLSTKNNSMNKNNNNSNNGVIKNGLQKNNTGVSKKSNFEGIYDMHYQNPHLQELMTMKTETVINDDEFVNNNIDQENIQHKKDHSKQLTCNNNTSNKRMNFSKTQSFNTIYLDNKSHFSNSNIQAQHPSSVLQEQTKNIIFIQNQELIRQSTSFNQEMFSINNQSMKSSNLNQNQGQNNQITVNNLNQIVQSKNIQQSQFSKEDGVRQFKEGVKFSKTQDINLQQDSNIQNQSEIVNYRNGNKKEEKKVFKSLQAQHLKTFNKLKTLSQNQQTKSKVNEFYEKSKCVNQLEPDKDWRQILQINSPENDSEDRELEKNFQDFEKNLKENNFQDIQNLTNKQNQNIGEVNKQHKMKKFDLNIKM